jgi:hypothetical protein
VGQAELVCAALSLPAIALYIASAERDARARARGSAASAWHAAEVAAALGLALAAALAKEIGITILGAMLAADVMFVPVVVPTAAVPPGSDDASHGCEARDAAGGRARNGLTGRLARACGWLAWREPKWARMAAVAVVGVAYVKLRSWVAVDQLVRIYRKVRAAPDGPMEWLPLSRTAPFVPLRALWS